MLSSQNSNIRRELCMLLSSRTQWTHIMRPTCEILNNCYQAGARFVSSAGTARGVKQLILPGVDFSPYSLLATFYLQDNHVVLTGFA